MLETVVKRLEAEYRAAGKERHFESLRDALTGDRDRPDYAAIGERLDMTADATRQAAQRLRKRYRTLLREEVAKRSPIRLRSTRNWQRFSRPWATEADFVSRL